MKNIQNVAIIILIIIVGILGYLYLNLEKIGDKKIDIISIDSQVTTSTSSENLVASSEDENTLNSDNIKTPLFIKNIYERNGVWFAEVDYVSTITPLEHMERRIKEGSCVIPNMSKEQMVEYSKDTVSKYVDQNNLLVVHCGYDWMNIRFSDGTYAKYYINLNSKIRTLSFDSEFNALKKYEVCGSSNFQSPEGVKHDLEIESSGIKMNEYKFDTYNTKGYFVDLAVIENGVIKEFAGEASCAG